jgi:hypothetical protein
MRVLRWIGIGIGVLLFGVAVLFGVARFFDGPLGPIPGGPLRGEASAEDPTNWAFAGGDATLELQVGERSRTVWFVTYQSVLYVAAAEAARKQWPAEVLEDPRVRLRVAGRIFDRKLVRVDDEALRDAVGKTFETRYQTTISPEAKARVWVFRVDPR